MKALSWMALVLLALHTGCMAAETDPARNLAFETMESLSGACICSGGEGSTCTRMEYQLGCYRAMDNEDSTCWVNDVSATMCSGKHIGNVTDALVLQSECRIAETDSAGSLKFETMELLSGACTCSGGEDSVCTRMEYQLRCDRAMDSKDSTCWVEDFSSTVCSGKQIANATDGRATDHIGNAQSKYMHSCSHRTECIFLAAPLP